MCNGPLSSQCLSIDSEPKKSDLKFDLFLLKNRYSGMSQT